LFSASISTAAAAELLPCITKLACWSIAARSIAIASSLLPLLS
jgi:hypothetical protein